MDGLAGLGEVELALSTLSLGAEWSARSFTPKQIAEDMELPQIGLATAPPDDLARELAGKLDLSSPLLIYSRRRRTKVLAQLLFFDEKQKAWVFDGPTLGIPKDYNGWFELVESNNDQISRFYAPCATIEAVAKTECRKFLVRSTMVGHRYTESEETGLEFNEEVKVYVGEILRTEGVVKRKWRIVSGAATTGNGAPPETQTGSVNKMPETAFLKCVDPRKNRFFVSLGHPGIFSPIYEKDKGAANPSNAVYQMADLLESERGFPQTVRLAFGWMPSLPLMPRTFQGVIRMGAVIRPDTLVMCSLLDGAMPLLELPLNMDIELRLDESKDIWLSHPASRATLKRCYRKVYPFLTSMKPMDIKYRPRADPAGGKDEGKNGSKEGGQSGSKDWGKSGGKDGVKSGGKERKMARMAAPIDMNKFSPLNVFPPLIKESDVAETWSLSFRDPDQRDPLERLMNARGGPGQAGHRDLRARRDHEVLSREADC